MFHGVTQSIVAKPMNANIFPEKSLYVQSQKTSAI